MQPRKHAQNVLARCSIVGVAAFWVAAAGPELRAQESADDIAESVDWGLEAYRQGHYESAILAAETALGSPAVLADSQVWVDATLLLSASYQSLGMRQRAAQTLRPIADRLDSIEDPSMLAALEGRLAVAYLDLGANDEAGRRLERAVSLAGSAGRTELSAALLNDQGNYFVAIGNLEKAIDAFTSSVALSEGSDTLRATASINLTRVLVDAHRDASAIDERLTETNAIVRRLDDSLAKADGLIALGELERRVSNELPDIDRDNVASAETLYFDALALAERLDAPALATYALGYLGALYEQRGQYAEALQHTRRAIFAAQTGDTREALYLWEWQAGRILHALNENQEAILAYRRAIEILKEIRFDVTVGTPDTYQKLVAPIFFEFADLMLAENALLPAEAVQANLRGVRDTLETAKRAEIEDYFDNQCVIVPQDREELDRLASEGAIIYPILLDDRLELVVSLPDGLHQFTSSVTRERLTEDIRTLRESIQTPTGDDFLPVAQRLYDWLIRPLESTLAQYGVDTLVFVPDGPLRTIPLSVLHDGGHFLVERYAIANTMGLELTNPRPLERTGLRVLANGISESVELTDYGRFPALEHVDEELADIAEYFETDIRPNEDFRKQSAIEELSQEPFTVVHFATHGHFDRNYTESYLLASDDVIKLNELGDTIGLRRFTPEAVELLVLSACETAAGDDRAALGLAGVALNAGARSALATLWSINDQSTALLMKEFYHQLEDTSVSKARALQQAQVQMIHNAITTAEGGARNIVIVPAERASTTPAGQRRDHPYYWAAFMLIGNWL